MDIAEWVPTAPLVSPNTPSPSSANKKLALPRPPPPVPKWKSENTAKKQHVQAPIDLSLADDEGLGKAVRTGLSSESPDVASAARKLGSPVENGDADLLYEYFPLSVDDWYVNALSLTMRETNMDQDAASRCNLQTSCSTSYSCSSRSQGTTSQEQDEAILFSR